VLRRAVIPCLFLLDLAGSSAAAPQELIPGLTYERKVELTARGPVVVNVLTVPRPGGLWSLKPVLSNEAIVGAERLTTIEKRMSATATVAGVNGDLTTSSGAPSGIVMRSGALDQPPLAGRSSIGLDTSGTLNLARVTMLSTWQGMGPRRALNDVSGPPGGNGVSLFTPAYGPTTPPTPGSFELALGSFPEARPNVEIAATVASVSANGGTPIPAGGAVLVARGTAATFMQKEAPQGQSVRIRLILKPAWSTMVDALGGGPVLVRNGKPIFRANEQFTPDQLLPRTARSAVGQLADGRLLLVTIDGSRPGYSAGATNFELALGDGRARSGYRRRPRRKRIVGDGVRRKAPQPAAGAGAPGRRRPPRLLRGRLSAAAAGDRRVAERRRCLRSPAPRLQGRPPSTVSVNLLGPDGVPRFTYSGLAAPGTYPLDWSGTTPDGQPELEGRWRWVVTAIDDTGVASAGERDFFLDRTLGFAASVEPALTVPRPKTRVVATFKLARAATITPRIETTSGVLLRTLPKLRAQPGDLQVAWDGVTDGGEIVYSGRYVAELTATNELGSVSLGAAFSVKRENVFEVAK
jgi:Phosphodiester glycosidase